MPKREAVAYGIVMVEVAIIVVLAYMRFHLHTLALIPGINSGPNAILGQQT